MSEIKLKPCPFCGGKAKLVNFPVYSASGELIREDWAVECSKCYVATYEYPLKYEPVEIWNGRFDNGNA